MIDETRFTQQERNWIRQAQENYYLKTHSLAMINQTVTLEVQLIAKHRLEGRDGLILILKTTDGLYFIQEILFSSWRYSGAVSAGMEETDIQELTDHLNRGNLLCIRLHERSSPKTAVLRYIKNTATGEWSGWESEEEFQNNGMPIFPFRETGKFPIKIFDRSYFPSGEMQLKISVSKRERGICRYSILLSPNTQPYDLLSSLDRGALLSCRYLLQCTYDDAAGCLHDISLATCESRYSALRGKKYAYNMRAMTALSRKYETIDLPKPQMMCTLRATILDHSEIDYRFSQNRYMLFLLEDGRMIMPFMSLQISKKAQSALNAVLNGRTNFMEHRSELFPGQNVELIFLRSQKTGRMALRGIISLDSRICMIRTKAEYLRDKYVRDGLLPVTELTVDLSAFTEQALIQYLESLKRFRRVDKHLFRQQLEAAAKINPGIDLGQYKKLL